jgi:integrase
MARRKRASDESKSAPRAKRTPWAERVAGRQKPKIDIRLPGFGAAVGRHGDRFRCSGGTWDEETYDARVAMLRELGARTLDPAQAWIGELLVAVLDRTLPLTDLHVAYRRGDAAMQRLLSSRKAPLLLPLLTRFLNEKRYRRPAKVRRMFERFLDAHGGKERVTTAILTRDRIAAYLAGYERLAHSRGGRKGEAVAPATLNRILGKLAAFCRWLVDLDVLPKNPTATIEELAEGLHRLPSFTAREYADYTAQLERDWRDEPRVLVLQLLLHTGADLGEIIGIEPIDGQQAIPGLKVSQIEFADPRDPESLTRLRLRRSKTHTPERQVPVPAWLAERLRAHIAAHDLRAADVLFPTTTRSKVAQAHARARRAIGREELRIKDLRHIAAIFWRKGGADVFSIQKWLGHADPKQTMIYADFLPDNSFDAPFVQKASQLLRAEEDVTAISEARKKRQGGDADG